MEKPKNSRPRERKTNLQKAFGAELRKIRLEQGLSQEALADLADLHFTYVSSVERGERNISLENIGKLAKALGYRIKDLFEKI
jgi:transcriptional regulator with XRE-family HTH domain